MCPGSWKRLRHLSLVLAVSSLVASGLMAAAAFASPFPRANAAQSSDKKDQPAPKTKIRIKVTNARGKPVGQASVYVRFNESGGLFHKDKLAELDLKTNDDGTARVPAIPQGKIMIQVIAKGWRTYGRWYDIEKEEETVDIQLQAPPHWY